MEAFSNVDHEDLMSFDGDWAVVTKSQPVVHEDLMSLHGDKYKMTSSGHRKRQGSVLSGSGDILRLKKTTKTAENDPSTRTILIQADAAAPLPPPHPDTEHPGHPQPLSPEVHNPEAQVTLKTINLLQRAFSDHKCERPRWDRKFDSFMYVRGNTITMLRQESDAKPAMASDKNTEGLLKLLEQDIRPTHEFETVKPVITDYLTSTATAMLTYHRSFPVQTFEEYAKDYQLKAAFAHHHKVTEEFFSEDLALESAVHAVVEDARRPGSWDCCVNKKGEYDARTVMAWVKTHNKRGYPTGMDLKKRLAEQSRDKCKRSL